MYGVTFVKLGMIKYRNLDLLILIFWVLIVSNDRFLKS